MSFPLVIFSVPGASQQPGRPRWSVLHSGWGTRISAPWPAALSAASDAHCLCPDPEPCPCHGALWPLCFPLLPVLPALVWARPCAGRWRAVCFERERRDSEPRSPLPGAALLPCSTAPSKQAVETTRSFPTLSSKHDPHLLSKRGPQAFIPEGPTWPRRSRTIPREDHTTPRRVGQTLADCSVHRQ